MIASRKTTISACRYGCLPASYIFAGDRASQRIIPDFITDNSDHIFDDRFISGILHVS